MLSIRKAKVNDLEVLAHFQLKLASETESIALDPTVVAKGLHALFADASKGVYYIAELNGEAVGCYLITFEWSEWWNGVVWWLQSVYVKEAYRKKKIFAAMYANVKRMIENDPNVIGLRLYVDKSNTVAQTVYASLGMNGDHYTVFEWMKR